MFASSVKEARKLKQKCHTVGIKYRRAMLKMGIGFRIELPYSNACVMARFTWNR